MEREKGMIQILDAKFLNDMAEEMKRARKKFPSNKHQFAALTEEVGEVANALLERDYSHLLSLQLLKEYDQNVWRECVQAAAMCLRVATEGDSSFKYTPPNYRDF